MSDVMIGPILDQFFYDTDEERKPDGLWHPSSLFTCDRQAVYQVRGTQETDPKKVGDHRPLAMGKAIHTMVQAAVAHASGKGKLLRSWHEVKVTIPTLGITGSADSLVELALGPSPSDGVEFEVEEFKSIKSTAIKFSKGGFTAKPEHVQQALTYVYGMRYFPFVTETVDEWGVTILDKHDPLGGRLKRARVTYFGKDGFSIHEFVVDLTSEWEVEFLEHIKKLNRYREDGQALPPRLARDDKGKKNWLCAGYCAFRSRCWVDDEEGVEL